MTDSSAAPNVFRRERSPEASADLPAQAFRDRGKSALCGLSWAILLLAAAAGPGRAAEQRKPIAIVDFDYVDTSGEAQNQTAKHQALLRGFMDSLRRDIAKSGAYSVVSMSCRPEPCSTAHSDPSELLAEARRAGASLLLYGGVHKESTLVQWAKAQMVDVQADKLVFDQLLTFRGDDDEAWRRAAAFLVEELEKRDFSK